MFQQIILCHFSHLFLSYSVLNVWTTVWRRIEDTFTAFRIPYWICELKRLRELFWWRIGCNSWWQQERSIILRHHGFKNLYKIRQKGKKRVGKYQSNIIPLHAFCHIPYRGCVNWKDKRCFYCVLYCFVWILTAIHDGSRRKTRFMNHHEFKIHTKIHQGYVNWNEFQSSPITVASEVGCLKILQCILLN